MAVEEESKLQQELMVKESKARMAAAAAFTIVPSGAALPPRKIVIEDDDIIDEVSQEVMNITLCFAGLPQEEIVRIFHNSLSLSTFTSSATFEDSALILFKTRNGLGSRMGCSDFGKHQGDKKTLGSLFIRFGRKLSTTIPPSLSLCLEKRLWTSTPPLQSSTAISTSYQ